MVHWPSLRVRPRPSVSFEIAITPGVPWDSPHNGHANLPHIYIPSVCKSTVYLYCRCERRAGQVFRFIFRSPFEKIAVDAPVYPVNFYQRPRRFGNLFISVKVPAF